MAPTQKKDSALEIIKRGTIDILPEKELLFKLEKSKKTKQGLIVKAGFDPTAPDLHLGHLVLLRKMKHFQDLGHEVHFLIGDFTGMIGDPSGRSQTRKLLRREEVEKNAQGYRKQIFRILDEEKTKICFNSTWCQDMKFEEVLGLTARYTVARLLERDDFLKRYQKGESISLIEFMYPLVQGYDSVIMKADIELGGSDQKFNLLVARELQSQYKIEPQVVITLPLLIGLDGQRKMSKSCGNYIGLEESPYNIFAKCMSISDELMWDYFILLTDLPQEKIEEMRLASSPKHSASVKKTASTLNPMEAKKILGSTIVDILHGEGAGEYARSSWEKEKGIASRQKMVLPPDIPQYEVASQKNKILLVDAIVASGLEKSKTAVRRLIESGSIKLGEDLSIIDNIHYLLEMPGSHIVKIGKKRYLKIYRK